jgi:putative acetyltransferase
MNAGLVVGLPRQCERAVTLGRRRQPLEAVEQIRGPRDVAVALALCEQHRGGAAAAPDPAFDQNAGYLAIDHRERLLGCEPHVRFRRHRQRQRCGRHVSRHHQDPRRAASRCTVIQVLRYLQAVPEAVIAPDDPRAADVRQLLDRHLAHAQAHTKPEEIYALNADALLDPSVSFFSYRLDGELLAVAALKRLDDQHAEIKSMHTAESARRRGIGREFVEFRVERAREQGYRRLSLETGAGSAFAAARALYARAGFTSCAPFAHYDESPNSVCMTLWLGPREPAG